MFCLIWSSIFGKADDKSFERSEMKVEYKKQTTKEEIEKGEAPTSAAVRDIL